MAPLCSVVAGQCPFDAVQQPALLMSREIVATEPGKSCYGRAKGCLRMLCQPMTVVDIAALVPFYTGLYMIASGNEATQPHL